jgi:carbamoyl-phosphate synthase small subunit
MGSAVGEVVFNTAMTGYQEILTDPSYHFQLVTMTYPQIGNYGINSEDFESRRIYAAGFIIRECSPVVSHWQANRSLDEYLKYNGVVGIHDIDTRALTRHLRDRGSQMGMITTSEEPRSRPCWNVCEPAKNWSAATSSRRSPPMRIMIGRWMRPAGKMRGRISKWPSMTSGSNFQF